MRRPVVVIALTAWTLLLSEAAQAQTPAGGRRTRVEASSDGRTATAGLQVVEENLSNSDAPTRSSASVPPECSAEAVRADFDRQSVLHDPATVPMRARFYDWVCGDVRELRWYLPGAAPPEIDEDGVDVDALVEEAVSRLTPPAPRLITSPPAASGALTGLPTYLAIDDGSSGTLTDAVSAGGVTVTVTLEPVGTSFDPGDGSGTRDCDGHGTVWRTGDRPGPDDCTHTYTDLPETGRTYPLSATVRYAASYRVSGAIDGEFDLGDIASPTATIDLPIESRRAVRIDR